MAVPERFPADNPNGFLTAFAPISLAISKL
jgi:hypothetical protein